MIQKVQLALKFSNLGLSYKGFWVLGDKSATAITPRSGANGKEALNATELAGWLYV